MERLVSGDDPAHHSKEIELKFEVDPQDAARVAEHPLLRDSLVPPEERDLTSAYFDTVDFALRKAGVFSPLRRPRRGIVTDRQVEKKRSGADGAFRMGAANYLSPPGARP